MIEIVPYGATTPALIGITRVAEQRRRMLAPAPALEGAAARRVRRAQLDEMDRELENLWAQRRRELASLGASGHEGD